MINLYFLLPTKILTGTLFQKTAYLMIILKKMSLMKKKTYKTFAYILGHLTLTPYLVI